jgi:hypothetical protein
MDFIEVNKYIDELRLSGHTWEEVNDICNKKYNKQRSKDTWRKPYEAWKMTVNDIINDTDNELIEREIERLARAKTRLDINRKVLNAQKSIIDQEVKKESIYQLFNEEVIDTLKQQAPKIELLKLEDNKNEKNTNYVFVHTDNHYDGSQDLNVEFSEILSIIREKQKEHNFKEIVFFEGGDACEGATLRPSQMMAIKDGLVSQAITYARFLSEFINILTKELNINVNLVMVETSNHTELRSFGSGRSEMPLEDLMRVIVEHTKLATQNNKRVNLVSASKIIETINGIPYLFQHGHDIVNKKNELEDMIDYKNKNIQYGYAGHYHNYETFNVVFHKDTMQYKSMTYAPHSKVNDGDFEEKHKMSSPPAILFSIDTPYKQTQEILIMRKSLENYLKKQKKEQQKKLEIKIR